MSFPHEVIAALPTAASADKELLRALLTRRFAYCLAPTEVASNFVAKDPVSGIPPLNLIQNGTLYAYDETDSTTAPSAVCLVTNDACRYKSGVVEPPYSVLSRVSAQPADVDVSDGDRLLLLSGVTGVDFAGKAGQIAVRKGAKWYFAISPIGRRLYVENEDGYYYRNAAGVWTAGNGSIALAANSVKITNVLGAKASFVIKVENQTTNAPPASPVAPVAYIIGPSPTGAWAVKAGQLAYCLVDGSYTYIVPATGDEVYDKSIKTAIRFNGTAWTSSAGAILYHDFVATPGNGSQTNSGSVYYSVGFTTDPLTSQYHTRDDVSITYAATHTGAKMRFTYRFRYGNADFNAVGILRDSVSNSVIWTLGPNGGSGVQVREYSFIMLAPDASSHVYKAAVWLKGPSDLFGTLDSRLFQIEEIA